MCGTLIVNSVRLLRFKVKWYYPIALFILLQPILCTPQQNCPIEISRVTSNASQTISWLSNSIVNEIVISDPPCIDQKENLIVRTCTNGSWMPSTTPECERIIANNTICPMFFEETPNSCIYISELQPWSTRCSLTKMLSGNVTKKKYPLPLKSDFVWLPVKRKVKYGTYEWVTMGEEYGKPIEYSHKSFYISDSFNKNCIISNIHNEDMRSEYCDKFHTHICPYYNENEFSTCPINCVDAGIGASMCYCKRNGHLCPYLTEINTPFDKNLVISLTGEDECYVGGINSGLQGYRQAVNKKHWFYTKKSLSCSICSEKSNNNEVSDVEMILTFDSRARNLFLQIYSPEGLLKNGEESYVYCFTDASKELKKRVEVEAKYEYFKKNDRERTFNIYKLSLQNYIGYYWCEAHKRSLSNDLVQSNKILAYKNKEGNEYSLRIVIDNVCQYTSCSVEAISYNDLAHKSISSLKELDAEIRVMEVFYFNYFKIDFLVHISMNDEEDVVYEYYKIKEELTNSSSNIHIDYFRSSEFCMPDITEEYNKLSWPLTYIDTSVVPEELCLQNNNLPIFRVCGGDFLYGAEWSDITGKCQNEIPIPESTKYLHAASKQNLSQSLIDDVTEVIDKDSNLSVLAIYYIEKIFEGIWNANQNNSKIIRSTMNMTNSLLRIKPTNLVEAQSFLNSTDNILDTIEEILTNFKVNSGVYLIQKQNIFVHITNPYSSNVSGVIVYSFPDKEMKLENFNRNNNFENILNDPNLLLAVYVPEDILKDILDQNLTDINIVTTIFFNDNLFVSSSKKPVGPIVSVTIPGYGNFLPSSLPVLFKSNNTQFSPECGFWDYGKNTQRKKGQWSTVGGNYLGRFNNESTIHSCTFSHLTHFALLILDENILAQYVNTTDDHILTVITFVGGTLTVVGITGIFVTAVLFEKWRKKQGTKILLNLSIAFFLEAITMHLTEIKVFISSDLSCRITGSIIHYIVLSKFLWMLVYAFLQYMRFVKVLGALPQNIVLKSAIFAWGSALVPVLIVNSLTPSTYSLGDFCYPTGVSLYLGLIMPVVFIILVNVSVFGLVMYQVSKTRIESHCGVTDSYLLQLKLATLLFFVLGIPWTFGVLANLIPIDWLRTTFIYLFCMTSTVQGFILFLFYVVFNRETRMNWTRYVFNKETSIVVTTSKT